MVTIFLNNNKGIFFSDKEPFSKVGGGAVLGTGSLCAKKVIIMKNNDCIELEQIAIKYQNKGEFEKAAKYFEKIINLNSDYEHGFCYYQLASCLEELGILAEAEKNYLKSLEHVSDDDIRLGGYASFLYLYGDPIEASFKYLELIKLKKQRKLDYENCIIALKALLKKITDETKEEKK